MNSHTTDQIALGLWVVKIPATLPVESIALYESWLSRDEHARQQRFRFEKDRLSFLVCRALMRDVLSSHLECQPHEVTFTTNSWGKPLLADKDGQSLYFNLSHTRGFGVLAVCEQAAVGIDTEDPERRTDGEKVAERFFSKQECEALEGLDPAERAQAFFAFWTLKEAYIKAVGKGLAIPLADFHFTLHGRKVEVGFDGTLDDDPADWRFLRFRYANRFPIAVAVNSSLPMELESREGLPGQDFLPARLEYLGGT